METKYTIKALQGGSKIMKDMNAKKAMWIGFYIQMIMLGTIFLLVFMGRQIPDIVGFMFSLGMLISIIASIFIAREKNKLRRIKEPRHKM